MSTGRVEFFLSCSDLTAHNAFIAGFIKDANSQKWNEIGRTEVSYNSNPKYCKQFIVDFIFEEEQQLRFDIYRSVNNATSLTPNNVIGSAAFKLSEAVHAKHQIITRTLTKGRKIVKNRASKRYSRLNLRLEPVNIEILDNTQFTFSATSLPKQGAFSKCNAILEIHRLGSDGKFFKVFETCVIKKSQNPNWPSFNLSSCALCNGDVNRALQLKIYHVDAKNIQRKYIGKMQINYNKLLNDKKKEYALKNTKGKECGRLILGNISVLSRQQNAKNENMQNTKEQTQISYNYAQSASNAKIEEKIQKDTIRKLQEQKSNRSRSKFLDYLQGGCELSMMIAIDFTGSNGQINDPLSLHYVNYQQMRASPYQDAIRKICPIVATYDSDQKFPVWGFGAYIHEKQAVEHAFTVNSNGEEVDGVNGIESAYLSALQSNAFNLSGPCKYSPILAKAIKQTIASHKEVMKNERAPIQYYILLILTNGNVSEEDKQQTKNNLIFASNNNLPLSVIFVGIGEHKFDFLNELDGDFDPIKDEKGNVAKRDIVQFVAMKDFVNKPPNELAKYTLREIPIQFVSYVQNNHILPRKNTNFDLNRTASQMYAEAEEDEHGHAHYKGDTVYAISQKELDQVSDDENDDDSKEDVVEPGQDPMANVPIPRGWERSYTATGRVFYVNHMTKSTQWDHPLKGKMNKHGMNGDENEANKMYNVQMMNYQFDNKVANQATQQQTFHYQPMQRSATFQQHQSQPQQPVYAANAIQKTQTMYAPQMQPQQNVVYGQQQVVYAQPQQPQRIAYDQYGRQIVLPSQNQPQSQQQVVYMQPQQQPQQNAYYQPQQKQQQAVYRQQW